MAGIISICYRYSAYLLVLLLALGGLITIPQTLDAKTEVDEIKPVIDAQMRSSDGIIAGCCVDEPLRDLYPQLYEQPGATRWFVIPSMYGAFDVSGCTALLDHRIYLCEKVVPLEKTPERLLSTP